jgi:hypothetical protein
VYIAAYFDPAGLSPGNLLVNVSLVVELFANMDAD